MRPTKFELMRANRNRLVGFAREHFEAVRDVIGLSFALPKAVVPTMDIGGVLYREAPPVASAFNPCDGCAFRVVDDEQCEAACSTAEAAFGASCSVRKVIYLKAA